MDYQVTNGHRHHRNGDVAIYSLKSAFEQSAQWGMKHYSIRCFARGFKISRNRVRRPCNIKILRIKGAVISLIF
jgi:hypothetical protein